MYQSEPIFKHSAQPSGVIALISSSFLEYVFSHNIWDHYEVLSYRLCVGSEASGLRKLSKNAKTSSFVISLNGVSFFLYLQNTYNSFITSRL